MRKSLLIALISLICPVLAMAQNMAFSKTARTSRTSPLTEERLYVTPAVVAPVVAGEAPSYSMGAVVKMTAAPNATDCDNNAVIMGYGGRNNINDNGCWNLCINNEGILTIMGWGGAAGTLATPLPLNEYVHLLLTYDADTHTSAFYMNGELVGERTWSVAQEWFTSEYPALYFASWQFGGQMDDIQIYNKCLSAEEAQVAVTRPAKVDGIIALYTMDEVAEGTTGQFADQSGANAPNLILETITAKDANRIWKNGIAYCIDDAPSWAANGGSPYASSVAESAPTLVESTRVTTLALTVVNDANLEYTITKDGVAVEDLSAFDMDDELQLTVVVPNDYILNGVTLDGEALTAEGDVYTFTMTQNSTLVIGAVEKTKYTVTLAPALHGSLNVLADGVALASGAVLIDGTVITINTAPNAGYVLSTLKVNDTDVTNGSTYTVDSNVTIAATFAEVTAEHCIPVAISGRLAGTTTGATDRYVTSATLTGGKGTLVIDETGEYANVCFGAKTGTREIYDVNAVVPRYKVEPGSTVTVDIKGGGVWVNTFIYFDADANGLDKGDRVFRKYSESNGMPVEGTWTFNVPSNLQPGVYRMRYMLNWDDNQGPCEYGQAGYRGNNSANGVADNGELIFDVDIVVPPTEVTVYVAEGIEHGTLVVKNGEEVVESGSVLSTDTELTLEATPEAGYQLVGLTANGKLVEGTTYVAEDDVVFSASFSNATYTLTVENEANLEYTLTQGGAAVTDLNALVGGAEYQLSVVVPKEYILNSVAFNGDELTAANGVYTFKMLENSTLVISATEKAKYTVTVEECAHATVTLTADGETIASGAVVVDGTELSISATAEEGWRVKTITVNGERISAAGGTITVNSDVNIALTLKEQLINYCVPQPVAGRAHGDQHGGLGEDRHRYLTSATISNGTNSVVVNYDGEYANKTFTATDPRPVYDVDAEVPELEIEAGNTITVVAEGDGSWMYTFFYLDADANGLDTGDLVWSNKAQGGGPAVTGTFSFKVPDNLKPGTYRMRHMIDWDGIGPCQYGQSTDNGEFIYDVDLVIPMPILDHERTITVATENADYGTVAILDPETEESTVTTDLKLVTVKATPAEGYAFLNWTNAAGEEVSTEATLAFGGTEDETLTAHFGHSVSYTVTGQGSFSATNAEGTTISNGQVLPVGAEVTFTLTPAAGKCVAVFSVNGESKTAELSNGEYTVALSENLDVVVDFADFTAHVSWVVTGNGEVAAGYDFNDDMDAPAIAFNSGDMLSANQFAEGGFSMFAYPGKVEGTDDEYESIESVTLQTGDDDTQDITDEVLAGTDGGPDSEGLRADGSPVYYYAVSELPSADLTVVFVFTEGGESAAIGNIFGDENDEPTLFYDLNGVRVNGNALAPGIYVAKKGKKTAKIYVM